MLDLLAIVVRRWRLIAGMIVIGVVASAGLTYEMTPSYRASAQLFVALDAADNAIELNSAASFSSQRVKSYPALVDSPLVLGPVIEQLGLDTTPQDLADDVRGEVSPNTVLIEVYADNTSPQLAADIANAVATNLAAVVEDLDRTREDRASPVRVSLTRQAVSPRDPRTPIPAVNIALGLIAGLLAGLGLAALREALDTTIKVESDVREVTGLPTLALIPTNADVDEHPVIGASAAGSVWGEAFRKLRTNLSYIDPDHPADVIAVASALPSDGKSLTAINLTASLAQNGRRALLVEADLRRPSQARTLGLDAGAGLTTVLTGQTDLTDSIQHCESFDVLVSGPIPPNPSELLGTQAFKNLVVELRGRYDTVVIDTPPLVAVTDAAVVAAASDAVLIVVRAKRTKRHELRTALFGLRSVDANVVGVVINQVGMSSLSYYEYGYSEQPAHRARQ